MLDYSDFDENLKKLLIDTGFVKDNISISHNSEDGSIVVNLSILSGENNKPYQTTFELPNPQNVSGDYDCVSYFQGNPCGGSAYNASTRGLYTSAVRSTNPNTIGICSTSFNNPDVPRKITDILHLFEEEYGYNVTRRVTGGFSDGGTNACREAATITNEDNILVLYDSENYIKQIKSNSNTIAQIKKSNTPVVYVSSKSPKWLINNKFFNAFLENDIPVYQIYCKDNLHNEGIIKNQYNYLVNDYLLNDGDLSIYKQIYGIRKYEVVTDSNGRKKIIFSTIDEDEFLAIMTIRSDNSYLASELIKIDISRRKLNKSLDYSVSFGGSNTSIPLDEVSISNEICSLVGQIGDKLKSELVSVGKVGDRINDLDYRLTAEEEQMLNNLNMDFETIYPKYSSTLPDDPSEIK